jgi:hypothetical protein
MLGAMGSITLELTGKPPSSPLHAFELSFACRTQLENFQRRRQTEFKHGRVSVVTLELTGKLPSSLLRAFR